MKHSIAGSHEWVSYLTAGLLIGAAMLRSLLIYTNDPVLGRVAALLAVLAVLFIAAETSTFPRPRFWFPIYLVVQTLIALALLSTPNYPDFFTVLFAILSMQVMQRMAPRSGWVCIALFAILPTGPLIWIFGTANGIAHALLYSFVNVLFASYALAARRALAARSENQSLGAQIEQGNAQLQTFATQMEQLAIARERDRLARELHDSVTQTVFSMTLTTQSALVLLDREPGRVGAQLERLNQLAQSALAEMRALISELRPESLEPGDLAAALRRHVASREMPDDLSVAIEVQGDLKLDPAEERALYRIAQEALNNVVKHAQASRAVVQLHLAEPVWIEIQDQGLGFDWRQAQGRGVGLASMRERASEIGWDLNITTAPGAGTCIRVEKRRAE